MKHLKTSQELNEASENLNISDVSFSFSIEPLFDDAFNDKKVMYHMKHIRKLNEDLESEKSLKNKLYKQDFESQIKALQYVIDFYEILSFEDIIKKRDNLVQQLKDFEKTVR